MFKSHVVLKLVCPLVEQEDGAIAQDTAKGGSLDCHLGTTGHLHTRVTPGRSLYPGKTTHFCPDFSYVKISFAAAFLPGLLG